MSKLTQSQRAVVEAIHTRLTALITPASPCAIAPEHKEAVRLYVQSWILSDVAALLESTPSEWADTVYYAKQVAKPEAWERVYGKHVLDCNEAGR
jgi:hypothetical protein